jgi:prevent-host-death family protein
MTDVASRELRNNTRSLLDRVARGESITVTVDGRAVAVLQPVDGRPRWLGAADFASRFLDRPADRGLLADVRALAPDSTDELTWP